MSSADAHGIRRKLESLDSLADLRSLFIEGLNYEYRDQVLRREDVLSQAVREPVEKLHIVAGRSGFDVILCTLDRLRKTNERPIAQQLTRAYYHALVVFTDPKRSAWHFCNLKHIETDPQQRDIARRIRPFRRMVVGETERLRTTSEQLSQTAAESTDTALDLHLKMDEAFDVEAVTRRFYKDFVHYYKEFRDRLMAVNDLPQSEADVHTQTIFNRLLFLYFVQKRGFLNGNPCYLYEQFRRCPPDIDYYQTYLLPLFRRLSDPDFEAPGLGAIPFLNGGLFEFDADERNVRVENAWFEAVYQDLLEHYNFTVREDTEFEQEVAVDPEMLGTVFEQLILGLESKEFEDIPDPRRASGSYYTPKFIVAFMVKESLMGYLQVKIPDLTRGELKQLVYNLEPGHLPTAKLQEIRDKLNELKAVDPGVGSGAFPLGLLLKMVEIIEAIDKEQERGSTERPRYRYELKRNLIERCIYGVDVQERAVHLAELRLWLSLLVEVPEPEPLPNLDLHIVTGDSLVSRIGGTIDFNLASQVGPDATGDKYIDRFKRLKLTYETTYDRAKKETLREKVEEAKRDLIRWVLETRRRRLEQQLPQLALMEEAKGQEEKEIQKRRQELKTVENLMGQLDELTETFNWGLDFADIMTFNGGFDLVIGNPPYGVKVPQSVKSEFGLGSRDSYGVFASLGLEVLCTHGTLCYIMSDTWQTIGTHKQLRDQLLTKTDARYLVSVPNDTFKATVNPGVYLFRRRHAKQRRLGGGNWILAADFSPLSISDGDVEVAFELLADYDQATLDETKDGHTLWSDREMAMFAYRQKLIPRLSNHSFFIASPKLFRLMRDVGNVKADAWVDLRQTDFLGSPEQTDFLGEIGGPPVHSVDLNGKELELVKLGDVADIVVGLQTGDNDYYLRQSEPKLSTRNYRVVDWALVIEHDALELIGSNEPLRLAVIQAGLVEDLEAPQIGSLTTRFNTNEVEVHQGEPQDIAGDQTLLGTYERRTDVQTPDGDVVVHPQDRYFGGRYFVPYDKGGASDIDEGWLPNYYVPTDYFIDWSERAVHRLRTLTSAGKYAYYGEEVSLSNPDKLCSRFQNSDYYFRKGISSSRVGMYSPLYRLSTPAPFDSGCSNLYLHWGDLLSLMGVMNSRLYRFLFKAFVNHTVNSQVEDAKPMPIPFLIEAEVLGKLVGKIVQKQKENRRYNYMSNEQVEINHAVYETYNLSDEDVAEVENWFWRRYPKLARAIEENQDSEG